MWWSGSRPLTVVRENMWGFLLFASVAWLAIAWSVLRLEPTDIVRVIGPVLLFGALTEAVRALAGTRMWWLNAGMAVLFTATGALVLADQSSSYAAPAALVGWYLMVRGAADIAVSMMTRETDRIWGLLMVVGVLEAGLGFFATGPLSRTADLVVVTLGGLALVRGVNDLVAALRLREVGVVRADILDLPPERAAGVAGYSAGLTDFARAPMRGPRHLAAPKPAPPSAPSPTTATATDKTGADALGVDELGPSGEAGSGGSHGAVPAERAGSFHDEVLRTTADLDAMLALAGVTGAAVGAVLLPHVIPEVPDTAEGVEPVGTVGRSSAPTSAAPRPATSAGRSSGRSD